MLSEEVYEGLEEWWWEEWEERRELWRDDIFATSLEVWSSEIRVGGAVLDRV